MYTEANPETNTLNNQIQSSILIDFGKDEGTENTRYGSDARCVGSQSPQTRFYSSGTNFLDFYFLDYNQQIVIRYHTGTITMEKLEELFETKFGLGKNINQNYFKFSFDPEFYTSICKFRANNPNLDDYQFIDKIANRRIYVSSIDHGFQRTDSVFNPELVDTIDLKLVNLSSTRHTIRIRLSDTVETLRKHVIEYYGIPLSDQRLIYRGTEITGARTLRDCGIGPDSVIQVVIRNRAGPYDWNYQRPETETQPKLTVFDFGHDNLIIG